MKARLEKAKRRAKTAPRKGTARRSAARAKGTMPAVILVKPQLGENIGFAARAMANFGLTDLRLVAPRDGWPNDKAHAAAAGRGGPGGRGAGFGRGGRALRGRQFLFGLSGAAAGRGAGPA